ncbi:MAG: HU family DNA-binding protein [Bacteroidales bacterium]|nr:HU family DNA-binding protein [Bacteroidales bacterium]
MSVKYTLVERYNPYKPGEPLKIYAQAVSAGETNLKQLGKAISAQSTLNQADIIGVLYALTQQIAIELDAGRIVRLDDFGSFQLAISSGGAEGRKAFSKALIRRSRIVFRPGPELRNMLKNLEYTRV